MALTVATWNVNSLRIRLEVLAAIDAALRPDVLCLQETKVADALFPHQLPADVWDHARLSRVVTHTPAEVSRLNRVMEAGGWIDAVRRLHPEPARVFTWWSYRAPDWRAAGKGRRLDHIWVSAALGERVREADVLIDARDRAPASDHAPVRALLDI